MAIGNVKSGTLGSFNVGLAASVGFVAPLGIQVDALVAAGLGPFQADLTARLTATGAAAANLTIQVGNPAISIQAILMALANIQGALAAALTLPNPSVELGGQLTAMLAQQATLGLQLGALQQAVQVATQTKVAALRTAAEVAAQVSAGPAFAFTFSGALNSVGAEIGSLFGSGLADGPNTIEPSTPVSGIVILTSVPSVQDALSAIIQVT